MRAVPFDEVEWYDNNAQQYAKISHHYLLGAYLESSDALLADDRDVMETTKLLAAGVKGLDAGCGAGARDVAALMADGYDVVGLDASAECLETSVDLHPELAGRLLQHDLRVPLPFSDGEFDFAMCSWVIQHLTEAEAFGTLFPELLRVLKPGGILLLQFKRGAGDLTLFDQNFGVTRTFRLFKVGDVLAYFESKGARVVPRGEGMPGGVIYTVDKRNAPQCTVWFRS